MMDDKRPSTPLESLEQSLKEMKSMRKGKLPKKSWDNLKLNLNKLAGEKVTIVSSEDALKDVEPWVEVKEGDNDND